jgi:hypothetical protein
VSFPVTDWQFWVATLVAGVFVWRAVRTVRSLFKRPGKPATLTVSAPSKKS